MRVFIVYCHPDSDSFTGAVRSRVVDRLVEHEHEIRQTDLYEFGFNPVLGKREWKSYLSQERDDEQIVSFGEDLIWADALLFVYPTWWYSMPAMLKGWLDRVLVPGIAFDLNPTAISFLGSPTSSGSGW